MRIQTQQWPLHLGILLIAGLMLVPFLFTINNSLRTNFEMDRSYFGLPESLEGIMAVGWDWAVHGRRSFDVQDEERPATAISAAQAISYYFQKASKGYRGSSRIVKAYILNSLLVSGTTVLGVLLFGSITAYILSRHRFPAHRALFFFIIGPMMFPAVLTLVPSFLLVKRIGLINTYWAMILPYIAGGQVLATYIFKSFFEGLPEDLFEAARIDGAGHRQIYLQIVLPLSKPVISVVLIMNVLSTWNNFLWPFITNTDGRKHVLTSGLYVLATSPHAGNYSSLFAAYIMASLPLLVLFTLATRPFIQGVTAGAFKA